MLVLNLVTLMRCFFLLNFSIFQGKKRFETDPPVGPFGTKVSLVILLSDLISIVDT